MKESRRLLVWMFWCFDSSSVWRPEAAREGQGASCCRLLRTLGYVARCLLNFRSWNRITSVICTVSSRKTYHLPARCPLPNDAASIFQPISSHRDHHHGFVSEAKPTTRLSLPSIPKKVKTRRESHWAWQTWQTWTCLVCDTYRISKTAKSARFGMTMRQCAKWIFQMVRPGVLVVQGFAETGCRCWNGKAYISRFSPQVAVVEEASPCLPMLA